MKKIFWLVVLFILGGCVGGARYIFVYQAYTNIVTFPALPVSQMREDIRWLVTERPIDEVKRYLLAVYPSEEPASHGVGHLLGEEIYRVYLTKAFGMCDPMFNYGCYHGVVDMAIRLHGPNEKLLEELKRACDKSPSYASACIHPLGHASAIIANYDAVKAFGYCDRLYPEPMVAFSCWNGAMMEYINRSAPNAPQAQYGRVNEPYYPCNTFPKKYEASCVSMHVSYLKAIWSEDFGRVIRYCQTYARVDSRTHCVDAIGSIIGQKYFEDPKAAIAQCRFAGEDISWCLNGVNVPYLAAHKVQDARIVCDVLLQRSDNDACHAKIDRTSKQSN
jgi:hypothetical protein